MKRDLCDIPDNIPSVSEILAVHDRERYDNTTRGRFITLCAVAVLGFFLMAVICLFGFWLIPFPGKMNGYWNWEFMKNDTTRAAVMRFVLGGIFGAVSSLLYFLHLEQESECSKKELLNKQNRYGNCFTKD